MFTRFFSRRGPPCAGRFLCGATFGPEQLPRFFLICKPAERNTYLPFKDGLCPSCSSLFPTSYCLSTCWPYIHQTYDRVIGLPFCAIGAPINNNTSGRKVAKLMNTSLELSRQKIIRIKTANFCKAHSDYCFY